MIRTLMLAIAGLAGCLSFSAPAHAEPVTIVALSAHDEAAYREAFEAIDREDWAGVSAALRRVDDAVLVGAVRGRMLLAQRRPSWSELTQWLREYGDYGMASGVYDRALERRPSRRSVPPPVTTPEPPTSADAAHTPPGDTRGARIAMARVAEAMGAAQTERARSLALGEIDGPRSGEAHWHLGLISFKENDYAGAARHFEAAAQWPYHGAWSRAAAHYWAGRAYLATGAGAPARAHFNSAAEAPWTFYGQLAETQLGRASPLDFTRPGLEPLAATRFLERHEAARRAAALAQMGRLSEVESELRGLVGVLEPEEFGTYLALAIALRAPSAQLRAAEYGGPAHAAGYCPANDYAPENGFMLDRALLFGIVRQESRFNPTAKSRSNARGLMQLLPSTAHDIDRAPSFKRYPTRLYDPALNMRLGQSYVQWLIDEFHSDGDLGKVFAAYNGGPGWLRRWMESQPDTSDPLYLLETLSRAESRDYAERVLSHMALCRKAFGQPTPEFDRLASGAPALYTPLDALLAER